MLENIFKTSTGMLSRNWMLALAAAIFGFICHSSFFSANTNSSTPVNGHQFVINDLQTTVDVKVDAMLPIKLEKISAYGISTLKIKQSDPSGGEQVHSIDYGSMSEAHRKLLASDTDSGATNHIAMISVNFAADDSSASGSSEDEEHLKAYLYQSDYSPNFDIVSAKCHATLCEVQALAYSLTPSVDWSYVIDNMRSQKWWNNFVGESTMISEQNGQAVIITYLHRRLR
jgi:hypothetical protein